MEQNGHAVVRPQPCHSELNPINVAASLWRKGLTFPYRKMGFYHFLKAQYLKYIVTKNQIKKLNIYMRKLRLNFWKFSCLVHVLVSVCLDMVICDGVFAAIRDRPHTWQREGAHDRRPEQWRHAEVERS